MFLKGSVSSFNFHFGKMTISQLYKHDILRNKEKKVQIIFIIIVLNV